MDQDTKCEGSDKPTATEYQVVQEGKAEIMFPTSNGVFYNPVQEFNRDLTIAVISEFSKQKLNEKGVEAFEFLGDDDKSSDSKKIQIGKQYEDGITILEALSASGIRSMRFAKEVPGVKKIVTNDFSSRAFDNIQKNIEHNKVEDMVTANLDDATSLMYQNRSKAKQFDVVDIDPYGSASVFIDSAVQAVKSGGLLCVTCTDMAVLAGNHPEACWSKYNSIPFKTKACHEQALRILLYTISSTAAKYARYIVPLISVSVDYYVRVFVRVFNGQKKANLSASQQMKLWRCGSCSSFYTQPIATPLTKGKSETVVAPFAPFTTQKCQHCDNNVKIGGPFWGSALHTRDFIWGVLGAVKATKSKYGSADRIIGILTMISEELLDVPFYYISDELSSILRCDAPSSNLLRSALMNSGYRVSAFHGKERSIKTDAPPEMIWDIMRKWVKVADNPTMQKRLAKLEGNSAARKIFAKPIINENIDLKLRRDCEPVSVKVGITRFPQMPPNWGPKAKATINRDGTMKLSANEKSRKFQGKRKAKQNNSQTSEEKKPKSEEDETK